MKPRAGRQPRPASWRIAAAGLVVGLGVAACGGNTTAAGTPPPLTFYKPATVLASGTPGAILSREPITLAPELHGTGWKITYVSTTPAGDLVPVTGVLIQPLTPKPPGGYPVVVYNHGTTGLGDQCAPSSFNPFDITGAAALLDAGDVIAAPDYEGLGNPNEIHPYLVGEAEGNNALDAARAAHTIGGNDVTVVWGWSQGGHATLFARSLQPTYAPELDLRGAAAEAPVTDMDTFLLPGRTNTGVFPYTAEAILAWSEVYNEADLTDLVNVQDAEKASLAEQACTGDIIKNTTKPLDEIFRSDPANSATWQEAAHINSVTVGDSTVPVWVSHSDTDPLVPVSGTVNYVNELCGRRIPTEFIRQSTGDHGTAFYDTIDQVDAWITDRIAGKAAPTNCP